MNLWDTKDFRGVGGEWFWGTAFFMQAMNEQNPSYDWYFVGLKFHYQSGIGVLDKWEAWMWVWDLDGREVFDTDAQPVYKDPFSGNVDLSVGTGGATVTVHLEDMGYDRGYWHDPGVVYYTEWYWLHDLTRADSDTWTMKSGAMVAKVQETNGNARAYGKVPQISYVWFGWDWGCWCDLYRYRTAEFPNGNSVTYGDQNPGDGA